MYTEIDVCPKMNTTPLSYHTAAEEDVEVNKAATLRIPESTANEQH